MNCYLSSYRLFDSKYLWIAPMWKFICIKKTYYIFTFNKTLWKLILFWKLYLLSNTNLHFLVARVFSTENNKSYKWDMEV